MNIAAGFHSEDPASSLALLRRILPKNNTGRTRFTDHITGNGEALFQKLEALNLEGMVESKRLGVLAFAEPRLVEGQDIQREDNDSEAHRNMELIHDGEHIAQNALVLPGERHRYLVGIAAPHLLPRPSPAPDLRRNAG